MNAHLVKYVKALDELNNTIEIKIWQLSEPTKDKPHGYRYSLAYISNHKRVIGYDNAERKGDHKHYGVLEGNYQFKNLEKLLEDFYIDIEKYKRGQL